MLFVSAIAAQETPQAIVFYEFDLKEIDNAELLTKKLNEFIERLSQEPETTRGFINIAGNSKLAGKIKSFVADNSNLLHRIVFNWNLKYPNLSIRTFDFYLIPQDAAIPYIEVDEIVICPTLSVDAPIEANKQNSVITFTAKAEGGNKDAVITYKWTVSAGKIIEGQNTKTIKVDPQGAKEVTANLEIRGTGDDDLCPLWKSFVVQIP